MSCGSLEYLARKYDSIAESDESMTGDSPAVTAAQMQAIQLRNRIQAIIGVMANKGCDIPDL
ncbi:hypothetical protein J5X84_02235 [Streptosporangiaceae bacterium NEAU-GS5]|nr:hypothetical protein [Streptosporangiaceae bacterium NEAU-GS5]